VTAPPAAGARLALLRVTTLPFAILAPLAGTEAAGRAAALVDLETRLDAEVPGLTAALHAAAGAPPDAGDGRAAPGRGMVIAVRRAIHNRRAVSPADLAGLRQRLAPELLAAVAAHLAGRAELAALREDLARAYQADLGQARRALLALAGESLFEEGIRLVSRSLLARVRRLHVCDPDRLRHDERHTLAKLTAYAVRFATKSSPNSLFCATALCWIGGGLARLGGANRLAHLDVVLSVAEARKISACIGADRAAWPAIVPRPNPTLRAAAAVWSFWRPSSPRRDSDDEVLCRTRSQPVLDLFLEEAGRGTLSVPELVAAVAARAEIEPAELATFCEQLIDKGILIAEIEVPYGCRRPLRLVAERMRGAGAEAPWLPAVEAVEAEVDGLPQLEAGERMAAMDRIEARLAALPQARAIRGDELFRVDAAAAIEAVLPARVREEIEVPLRRCVRLFAALYPELAFRRGWAQRFLTRHPADTDVALLDLYHGLFEPVPAAQHRPESFPEAPPGADAARQLHVRTRELLAARARAALAAGREEVELEDEDWEALIGGTGGLPEPRWSAGVLFQIAAGSAEEIAAGRYRAVLNALFGAGIALARFAHLHGGPGADNAVAREVARSWQPLARPGAVLAEVTYNHLGRTANAGLRPALFRHEIELPGSLASPGREVIPLREMTVRWDTAAERFVLLWTRGAGGAVPAGLPGLGGGAGLAVEVIPILSSGVSPEASSSSWWRSAARACNRSGGFRVSTSPRCGAGRVSPAAGWCSSAAAGFSEKARRPWCRRRRPTPTRPAPSSSPVAPPGGAVTSCRDTSSSTHRPNPSPSTAIWIRPSSWTCCAACSARPAKPWRRRPRSTSPRCCRRLTRCGCGTTAAATPASCFCTSPARRTRAREQTRPAQHLPARRPAMGRAGRWVPRRLASVPAAYGSGPDQHWHCQLPSVQLLPSAAMQLPRFCPSTQEVV
jgi:hypothetical protein